MATHTTSDGRRVLPLCIEDRNNIGSKTYPRKEGSWGARGGRTGSVEKAVGISYTRRPQGFIRQRQPFFNPMTCRQSSALFSPRTLPLRRKTAVSGPPYICGPGGGSWGRHPSAHRPSLRPILECGYPRDSPSVPETGTLGGVWRLGGLRRASRADRG